MTYRFLFLFFWVQAIHAEEYHFSSISGSYAQLVGEEVLTQIYSKIGADIKVTRMPAKRAAIEATKGRVDGEVMRIWSYGADHKEVIRVPTSYYYLETMAFYKKGSGVEINSNADLEKYSTLRVRGVKHARDVTEGLENVYDYNDVETMLKAVDKERQSVALAHRTDALFAIQKFNILDLEFADKPLSSFPLYHYVHKNNAHLVDTIDRLILQLKHSGELGEIIESAERKVFESNGLVFKPWY